MGRGTYQVFAQAWPSQTGEFADRINTMHRRLRVAWPRCLEDAMRYALLIYRVPAAPPGMFAEERPAETESPAGDGVFDDWVAYTRALKRAGVLVGAEQLQAADTATSVRVRAGERLLTDGPYIETKEHLLGFYLVDVADLDAAIDWAARMPHVRARPDGRRGNRRAGRLGAGGGL